jgi:hypothetical protein
MGEFEMQNQEEVVIKGDRAGYALGLLLLPGLLVEGNGTGPAQEGDPALPVGIGSHRREEALEKDAL